MDSRVKIIRTFENEMRENYLKKMHSISNSFTLVFSNYNHSYSAKELNEFIKELKTFDNYTINWYLGVYSDDFLMLPNELKSVVLHCYCMRVNKTF